MHFKPEPQKTYPQLADAHDRRKDSSKQPSHGCRDADVELDGDYVSPGSKHDKELQSTISH